MNFDDDKKRIEYLQNLINKKVEQYCNAEKKYNGDSALSNRLEEEISSLNSQLQNIKKKII